MLLALLIALLLSPAAAHAQVTVVFSGSTPVLRARVGPIVFDAPVRIPRNTRVGSARAPRSASASARRVLDSAENYLGTPYVWGGESPKGFDCSGFVQYVFREQGIELPRTSQQQAQVGRAIAPSRSALQPGDLMFFASGGPINHVAIYAGDNRIIQASGSAGAVVYDDLDSNRGRWFATHHVATRRVIEDGTSLVGPLKANLLKILQFDPPDQAPKH